MDKQKTNDAERSAIEKALSILIRSGYLPPDFNMDRFDELLNHDGGSL